MKPIRVPDLRSMKERGEKIAALTAYDVAMARLLDRAGIDMILVGDSLGMVVLGFENTLPVTLDMMIHHTKAVSRGAKRALIVAELLERAGAFAIVLESIPADLSGRVTASLKIPTIGIGAGTQCDGQVLVINDVLGLSDGPIPPFAKQYAQVAETILSTARAYIE